MNQLREYLNDISVLLTKDKDFIEEQYKDNKFFSIVILFLYSLVGPGLWIWDYVTDPIGAQDTILFRAAFFFIFNIPIIFLRFLTNIRMAFIIILLTVLVVEIIFINIMHNLDGGMSYGIAGFMYFFLAGLLILQGFSLIYNILYTICIAIFPLIFGYFYFPDNFQFANYSVLIIPASITTILMQVASSFSYLKKYRVEQKLKLASNHDPLTGSYNRRYFFESGEIIFQKNKRKTSTIAVIMLDIDNFKKINDTYGHSVGDIAIKEVPIILGANLRETDLVARFGGEEFCILLEDISLDKTKKLANRIVKLFKDNHILIANNEKINYTVSLGVAYGTSNSLTNMINLSDGALYESKNNGKNTYTAYDLMTNNKIQLFEVTRSYPCP